MNEQQKKQMVIVAILGVVLVGVLIYQFRGKPGGSPAAPKPAAAAAATPGSHAPAAASAVQQPQSVMRKAEVNIDELLMGIKEVDFDYARDRMPRDPLAPLVGTVSKKSAAEAGGDLSTIPPSILQVMNKVVAGILWDKTQPLAVVDNEVVYPGYEYPDGTLVYRIDKDSVTFKVGDSEIQVELKEL